jgi:hypothetical protein
MTKACVSPSLLILHLITLYTLELLKLSLRELSDLPKGMQLVRASDQTQVYEP